MNPFNKRTAIRIAAVSSLLTAIASPIAWFSSREKAEESLVSLAMDESLRLLDFNQAVLSMMESLGRAIAKRDSDTGAHNYRVAWIASRIASEMGLQGKEMQSLIAGSFLHDVGKIGIPDAILLKPGKLDETEFAIMRTHVQQGEEIVTGMGWLDGAHDVVSGHHEKWNGCGYPLQLVGTAIPLAARIFAVADVFDALCSKRPYKNSMPLTSVITILENDTGTHFDPAVMQIFLPMAPAIHNQMVNASEEDVRLLLEEHVREYFEM